MAILALMHGNEIAGAIVLDRLLRANLRIQPGKITFGFVNIAAFERFDPRQPTASRFVDEDMNRIWEPEVLDGPRHSVELDRARQIRPLIDTVDVVLDLHSMLWPADPLLLCGASEKGKRLARKIAAPLLVVADAGHASGKRLIDYPRFVDPSLCCAANLIEAGQHWRDSTIETMLLAVAGLLRECEISADDPVLPAPPSAKPEFAEVTTVVTARTPEFTFMRSYRGGEVISERNTLVAMDGPVEIRTPYDNCLLVMPSLRPSRGHTAVRLARFVEGGL
jgi:hypothetical protein